MFLRPLSRTPWRSRLFLSPTHRLTYTTHPDPPFPTTPKCPSPTCECASTPTMPEGLEIDHSKSLNGTMAPYAEQVIICTGKDDWPSRIEEENAGDNLVADIKELVGRGGEYADPYNTLSLLTSSLPPSTPPRPEIENNSAYLFPSFKYIPFLPRVSFASVRSLVQGYLLPKTLHPAHDNLSPIHRDRLTRSESEASQLWGVRDIQSVMILICGHGGRDQRCGIMGPILRAEFEKQLLNPEHGLKVLSQPVKVQSDTLKPSQMAEKENTGARQRRTGRGLPGTARVALVSHVGGHKWAGNVGVYIPPGYRRLVDGVERGHELAGKGVWYGRVEPKHVEGILRETVGKGRVIEELFRGGIGQGGEVLRL